MKQYRFEAEAAVEIDVESAFDWYEAEDRGLGLEFLEQLSAAYRRLLENSLGYQELRSLRDFLRIGIQYSSERRATSERRVDPT